jgi:hypothetical protein
MTNANLQATEQIPAVEIYKQHYAHFGRMNDLIYKLPTLYSALIGALWFFAYTAKNEPLIAPAVFLFAAVICLHSIHVTKRFRTAFNLYIDRINAFDREYAVSIRAAPGEPAKVSTLAAFVRMLWVAFAISVAGVIYVLAPTLGKLGMESNTWCPRPTAWIILSGLAVHVKGFGSALCSTTKRLIAACKSTTDRKMPRFNRRRATLAKKPSTALSQDAEVGVKWNVQRGCLASHFCTLGCLWVA